jgi:hypothetical protein
VLATAPALVVILCAGAPRALADGNYYLCCDLVSQPNGACLPQSSPCASSTGYAVALHNLPGAQAPGDYPFPDGIPGVMSLADDPAGPWQGLCLFQAPDLDGSAQVLDQTAPVKPTQCIQLTVTAATAVMGGEYQFPAGNWNAYAACWGAPPNPDGGQPCIANLPTVDVTDGGYPAHGYDPDSGTGQDNHYDPAITLTSYPSNSCCGPLIGLRFQQSNLWQVSLSQEVPTIRLPPGQDVTPRETVVVGDGGESVGGGGGCCSVAGRSGAGGGAEAWVMLLVGLGVARARTRTG